MSKLVNWKSYYLDEQVDEYNLTNYKDDNIEIRLFNTNDLTMDGDYQINYLNSYLGELPMMYYIWKNNIKSDYICISQYRKDFSKIDFERLANKEIQTWCYWKDQKYIPINILFNDADCIDPDNYIKHKFIDYIDNIQHIYPKQQIELLKSQYQIYKMACFVFCMKWEIYEELCSFIFGFLDYLFPNNSWQNIDIITKFQNEKRQIWEKIPNDKKRTDWIMIDQSRYLVFIMEKIFSTCLTTLYPVFQIYYNNVYCNKNILTFGNNIFEIASFYKKNKKLNTEFIYVQVPDDKFDELNDFFTKYSYSFPNIKILKKICNIAKDNIIKLNINEYINIDNTYCINEMTIDEINKYKIIMI